MCMSCFGGETWTILEILKMPSPSFHERDREIRVAKKFHTYLTENSALPTGKDCILEHAYNRNSTEPNREENVSPDPYGKGYFCVSYTSTPDTPRILQFPSFCLFHVFVRKGIFSVFFCYHIW